MRVWIRLGIVVVVLAIAALIWRPWRGYDVEFRTGDMTVIAPWARATPGPLKIGAAYMGLTNHGAVPDRLLGAQTPAAERVELHTTISKDGVMQMRPVDSVALPPGQVVRFEPAGLHFMLMNLAAPLKEGSEFIMQLTFERAGVLEVRVAVGAVGAAASPDDRAADHPSH